ncbi:type VI secretion system tube protein TssD [Hymenobacter glaciei]|uniref:Type VI secretion system tube protein TssD n=1 Tax=Hymenobacter glaciei TaxID=877209 RepID=A0ABP7TJZ5_9BACT
MAFSAALILANKSYTVRRFNWGVQQNTDAVGRPDARVQGGQLMVELDSEPDETVQHWALDDTKQMSGELVVFSAANRLARRKTIRFEEAYCVGLSKNFDGSGSAQGMTMTLTVSANKLSSGEVTLDNKWPV